MSQDLNHSRHLSATAGWHWFIQALRATQSKPLGLMGIAIFYIMGMGLLSALPIFGPVLAALFMPFGTVFLAWSTRDALQGKIPSFSTLSTIWKDFPTRVNLFRVGLVFGFFLVTVNALYGWLSADEISQWTIQNDRLVWSSVLEHFPYDALIVVLLIYVPGLMATWFAPMLVAEKNMVWGKAVFYSFFGCLRNLLPIIFLRIILFTAVTLVAIAAVLLCDSLGINQMQSLVMTPIAFLSSTVIYATYWPMYKDLFGDVARERVRN